MSEKVDTSREAVYIFLALSKDGWAKELVAALLAANESLAKDAERYRKLRELTGPFREWKVSRMISIDGGRPERNWVHADEMDAALDAADASTARADQSAADAGRGK